MSMLWIWWLASFWFSSWKCLNWIRRKTCSRCEWCMYRFLRYWWNCSWWSVNKKRRSYKSIMFVQNVDVCLLGKSNSRLSLCSWKLRRHCYNGASNNGRVLSWRGQVDQPRSKWGWRSGPLVCSQPLLSLLCLFIWSLLRQWVTYRRWLGTTRLLLLLWRQRGLFLWIRAWVFSIIQPTKPIRVRGNQRCSIWRWRLLRRWWLLWRWRLLWMRRWLWRWTPMCSPKLQLLMMINYSKI